MKHTVILSSYNRPNMIQRALRSIIGQTVQDFQVLITDDGSNKETIAAIKNLIGNDNRFELHVCSNPLNSDQRTNCAARATQRVDDMIPFVKGHVVHYLADDDWYALDRFEIFEELFSDKSKKLGYGRLIYMKDSKNATGEQRYFPGPVKDPYCVLDHNQAVHLAVCFERVPHRKVGNHGDYANDGRFLRKLTKHYGPFYGIDRIVGYKCMHGLNMQWTQEKTTSKREA